MKENDVNLVTTNLKQCIILNNRNLILKNFKCVLIVQIFLNRFFFLIIYFKEYFLIKKDSQIWTKNEISKEKLIRQDWCYQLCYLWTDYLFIIPWVWLLTGFNSTIFAGSWTLVNTHEVASIRGLTAAYRFEGDYPEDLENDHFALLCFR